MYPNKTTFDSRWNSLGEISLLSPLESRSAGGCWKVGKENEGGQGVGGRGRLGLRQREMAFRSSIK